MTETPVFTLTTSRGFTGWRAGIGGSIALTTYQGGKVFLLGLKPDGTLSVFERSFPRCMGLAVSDDGRTLLMARQVSFTGSTMCWRKARCRASSTQFLCRIRHGSPAISTFMMWG